MIGLTCSWAWSMGPVLCPSCLCVLASQIVKRRRGAEPVSISFFLSIISCLPLCLFSPPLSLPPFIDDQPVSSSCCGRKWMLCMWVNEVHSLLFSVWKHFCLSCPVFKKLLNFSSVSQPKWRDFSSVDAGEREVFTLLHCIQWFLSESLCA